MTLPDAFWGEKHMDEEDTVEDPLLTCPHCLPKYDQCLCNEVHDDLSRPSKYRTQVLSNGDWIMSHEDRTKLWNAEGEPGWTEPSGPQPVSGCDFCFKYRITYAGAPLKYDKCLCWTEHDDYERPSLSRDTPTQNGNYR